MIRLAHLSDIHVTVPRLPWTRADWFNKRLAAWLNFSWLGRGRLFHMADDVLDRLITDVARQGFDRVVFSGDASALGFAPELAKAAQLLRIETLPGLAVPGNHDYCTIPAARSGHFEQIFAPWQQGERLDGHCYPFAQRVGPGWLIGVNSSTGNRWAWDAGGRVGPEQRDWLAKLLARLDGGPRILVTHFPVCLASGKPERLARRLRDLRELIEVAEAGGVSLWLHGHRHAVYHFQASPVAPFPIVCIGSATQTDRWSYGDYTINGTALDAVIRRYDSQRQSFEEAQRFQLQLRL